MLHQIQVNPLGASATKSAAWTCFFSRQLRSLQLSLALSDFFTLEADGDGTLHSVALPLSWLLLSSSFLASLSFPSLLCRSVSHLFLFDIFLIIYCQETRRTARTISSATAAAAAAAASTACRFSVSIFFFLSPSCWFLPWAIFKCLIKNLPNIARIVENPAARSRQEMKNPRQSNQRNRQLTLAHAHAKLTSQSNRNAIESNIILPSPVHLLIINWPGNGHGGDNNPYWSGNQLQCNTAFTERHGWLTNVSSFASETLSRAPPSSANNTRLGQWELLRLIFTGTRKRRISVRARAMRAWASAGAAYAVISTWSSSLRCL